MKQEEKGLADEERVGWHHRLSGHEFEQTSGDGEGQGSLACYNPWGCKELDTTEQLNNDSIKLIGVSSAFLSYVFLVGLCFWMSALKIPLSLQLEADIWIVWILCHCFNSDSKYFYPHLSSLLYKMWSLLPSHTSYNTHLEALHKNNTKLPMEC